jgi:hypothetical protein
MPGYNPFPSHHSHSLPSSIVKVSADKFTFHGSGETLGECGGDLAWTLIVKLCPVAQTRRFCWKLTITNYLQ